MKKASGMSDRTSQMILVAICAVVLIIVAYPLYYVVVASFSDPYEVYAGKTFLFPSGFTLDGYKAVFADPKIMPGFLNSVKYTVIGTVFSVAIRYSAASSPRRFRVFLLTEASYRCSIVEILHL